MKNDFRHIRSQNKLKRSEYYKEWYAKNRERLLEYRRDWYKKNRARHIQKCKEWVANHPDKKRASGRRYYHKNRAMVRDKWRHKTYGITTQEFNDMIAAQGGKCAICEGHLEQKPVLDHCHVTGRIRGVLCDNCNKAIGLFKESTDIIKSALEYLLK